MAEELIISISGMRGIVGENLFASIASEYASAFGSFLKARHSDKEKLTVCIGRDSRPSGQMLQSAVTEGLCAVGVDVVELGIVTTPCVGIMLRELGCVGGVVITASHNPLPYNGIKLLLDNGMAPFIEQAGQIRKCYDDRKFALVGSDDRGKVVSDDRTDRIHIEKVLKLVEKEAIASKKFKVALDSVNGAGGRITKAMLAALGCEVVAINDEPTGLFAHTPEPTVDNVTELCDVVKANNADVGFAQDPDADRLAIVDENGAYIGEEYTLALTCKYILGKIGGTAAVNLSTSRMVDDVAAAAGAKVLRTAVGEVNVAKAMVENNCVIGGEGNGGVIDLRVGPIRDSLVGIALVLALMTETGKTISQLVTEIGGYYVNKDKFAADRSQAKEIIELAKEVFSDAKVNTIDGCRFDFQDGWMHLRSSNTEPVMRVIVEAKDEPAAKKYIDVVSKIRKKVLG